MHRKKFLGQNFLSNKNILNVMADSAELSKNDVVLEAGPGTGTLTEILAERAKKVIAVEKDDELIPFLKSKFRNSKNIEIVSGDILTTPLPLLRKEGTYKIVANIPYYITSHFLRKFLEGKNKPSVIVLMIQKEVAERIVAKPARAGGDGKESLLSLSVKAYGKPEIIRVVPRGAFSPPPNVDSAIIKIITSPLPLLTPSPLPLVKGETRSLKAPPLYKGRVGRGIDVEKILALAKIAFGQKRKMLRQSIGKKVNLPQKYQIMRPEELSLADWVAIYKNIN